MIVTSENRGILKNPVQIALCRPEMSHGLARDRTLASAMTGRQLHA